MAVFEIKIFGIEIAIGGTSDPDVYEKSMFKLTHSTFVKTPVLEEEINVFNFRQSIFSSDVVSEGEIEPYER
jgi:hypothetical protein